MEDDSDQENEDAVAKDNSTTESRQALRALYEIKKLREDFGNQLTVIHHPCDALRIQFLHQLALVLLFTCLCTLLLAYGLHELLPENLPLAFHVISIASLPVLFFVRKIAFLHSLSQGAQVCLFVLVVISASFYVVAIHRTADLAIFSNALIIQIIILLMLLCNPVYLCLVTDRGDLSQSSAYAPTKRGNRCYSNYLVFSMLYILTSLCVFGYLLLYWIFERNHQHMSVREWFFPPPYALFVLVNLIIAFVITASMFMFIVIAFYACQPKDYVVGALDVFVNMMLLATFVLWLLFDVVLIRLQCKRCSCR